MRAARVRSEQVADERRRSGRAVGLDGFVVHDSLELAQQRGRERRRVDSREPLGRAHEIFEALGARPCAEAAADELDASGVTVARHGVGGLDLLTPREGQIVTVLLDGRPTRAAAATLFLSPKTVLYHLRHVYTKLGLTSRRELAALVATS